MTHCRWFAKTGRGSRGPRRWRLPSRLRTSLAVAFALAVLAVAILGGAEVSSLYEFDYTQTDYLGEPRVVSAPKFETELQVSLEAPDVSFDPQAAAARRVELLEERRNALVQVGSRATEASAADWYSPRSSREVTELVPEAVWNQHEPELEEPEFSDLLRLFRRAAELSE